MRSEKKTNVRCFSLVFNLTKQNKYSFFFKRDFFSIISIKHIERGEEKQDSL